MKKIRNDKMDGRFYSDEYVGDLNKRIYDLREENKQLKERIEKAIDDITQLDDNTSYNNAYEIQSCCKKYLLSILQYKE